jgi:hypothetical protein
LPFRLPGVPVRRPCIESSAKMEIRFLRSAEEMSAVVDPRGAGAPVTAVVEPPHAAARGRVRVARSLAPRMNDHPGLGEGGK